MLCALEDEEFAGGNNLGRFTLPGLLPAVLPVPLKKEARSVSSPARAASVKVEEETPNSNTIVLSSDSELSDLEDDDDLVFSSPAPCSSPATSVTLDLTDSTDEEEEPKPGHRTEHSEAEQELEDPDEPDLSSADEDEEAKPKVEVKEEVKQEERPDGADHKDVKKIKKEDDDEVVAGRNPAAAPSPEPREAPKDEEVDIKPKLPGNEEVRTDDIRLDFETARSKPRPTILDASFTPFDPSTWGCIDRENGWTRRMRKQGGFHRFDIPGGVQGWWCSATDDQRRLRHKTARMAIFGDARVNEYCRGAGKAFGFRYYPLSYKTKRISAWVRSAELYRKGSNAKEKDEHGRDSEWWEPYGIYTPMTALIPTGEDFLKLDSEEKKTAVVDRFVDDLRTSSSDSWAEVIFDGVFLGSQPDEPGEPRRIWETRLEADEEEQRAAVREALEHGRLNVAYNIFRYKRSSWGEVRECCELRKEGRRLGRPEARRIWAKDLKQKLAIKDAEEGVSAGVREKRPPKKTRSSSKQGARKKRKVQ
ncbi:hypothetical protein JCM10213v2_002492 [Rhodosporidiobolus nylandii]